MLSAEVRGAGILAGPGTRDAFGENLSSIVGPSGNIPVGGTYSYPRDGRWPELDYAALAEAPELGAFDQCWLQIESASDDVSSLLFTALMSGYSVDHSPELSQLNPTLGRKFDLKAELEKRTTRIAPLAALVIGLVLGASATLSRRLHLASALHAGVGRPALSTLCLLESAIWAGGSAISSVLFAYTASLQIDPSHRQLLDNVSAEIGTLFVIGVAAGALMAFGVVKERRLFAYFKGSR
jgi:hypothetical protein